MAKLKYSPGGDMIEQGSYSWEYMRMFTDFIVTASPDIREEISKEVRKVLSHSDPSERKYEGYCRKDDAVNLGDKYDGWGPNILYVWFNGDGEPFYVGQSKYFKSRPTDIKYRTRSEEFQAVVRKGDCHVEVVAMYIPDSKIDDLEKELIRYLSWEDYPLVNKRDMPTKTEKDLAHKICKYSGTSVADTFLSQTEYKDEMRKLLPIVRGLVGKVWLGESACL